MAQPWTGLLTPPDSPRKRRQQLRESEEVTGIMSIEQYICRTDVYRSTSLNDPPPLPVRTEPANVTITEIIDKLSNEISSILYSNDLPPTRVAGKPVAQTVFKPGYPGYSPKTVLRVLYRSMMLPRNMGPAKDELVELLRRNKIENVEIEILDINKCFRPSLFAISAKDPAVGLYKDCKARMIQILNKVLNGTWKTLCLYNVGPNKSRATPTIVVTIQPRTTCDWHRLMLDLREVQPKASHLPVEFLPGGLGNLGGNSQLDSMREDASPQMGDSITVAREDGGGTLGIFSILNYGNETHTGFITNFHVVRPAESATSDVMDRALRHGSSLDVEDETKCQVVRFAPKDSQETVIDGSVRVSELNTVLYELRQQKYYREMVNADLPRHLAQNITEYESVVASYEKKIGLAKSMPTPVGRVLLSSGMAMWNNRVVDWAFVELGDDISFRSNVMPNIPQSLNPSKFGLRLNYREGASLTRFDQIKENEWYCKTGKSTGLTSGICNGVKMSCHWNDTDRQRYDLQGNQFIVKPEVTEEFVILDQAGDHIQTDFAQPGDSGSVLIDRFGCVCGLLYDATYTYSGINLTTYTGLAMTMPDVSETIRLKTHNKAQDPKYAVLELPQS